MSMFDTTWSVQAEKILPPVLRDADFILNNMDFKSGEGENQFIKFIMLSSPGHWKEKPLVGIGIYKYLNGTQSKQVLQRNIKVQLEADNAFKKPLVDVTKFPTIIINSTIVKLQ